MSNLNLIAHCGANYVDRRDLGRSQVPPCTETHTPIAHDYFVDLVEDRLNAQGLRVVDSAFALSSASVPAVSGKGKTKIADANMFGVMQIGSTIDADYATVVGLRNSHAKWFAAELAAGSGVFVCDNLAFTGGITMGRKHTAMILEDLPLLIDDTVHKLVDVEKTNTIRYDAYKGRQFSDFEAEFTIVEMLRRGVITTQRVEKVVQQWDVPDHEQFAATGRSAWRLFNAATEALKGHSLPELTSRTQKLHTLIDEVAELNFAEAA